MSSSQDGEAEAVADEMSLAAERLRVLPAYRDLEAAASVLDARIRQRIAARMSDRGRADAPRGPGETINDMWPDPEAMPEEMKQLLNLMGETADCEATAIKQDPKHHTKPFWQVDTTAAGAVTRVWVNKVSGQAAGLWRFELTIDDDGVQTVQILHGRWTDGGLSTAPCGEWTLPWEPLTTDELVDATADLVGVRTARGVIRRLFPAK